MDFRCQVKKKHTSQQSIDFSSGNPVLVNRSMGVWGDGALGDGEMEHWGIGASVLGDVCDYLIWHFCFIAVSQYDAQCPSYLGLWDI